MSEGPELPKFDTAAFTKKLAGVPVYVWVVLGLGALGYVIYSRRKSSTTASTPTTATGSGDYQAAGDSAGGTTTGASDAGTSTSSTQAYADNGSWGTAAVNWLVGHGYDATLSNQAVNLFLASQTLTTQEQAMVNLAITALGAPPQLVPPVAGGVTPVTGPGTGGGTVKAPAAPTGLKAGTATATTVPLSWTATSGATGYGVYNGSTKVGSPTGTSYTVTGLKAATKYSLHVVATNTAGSSPASASLAVTTKGSTTAAPPKSTAAPYTVKAGDSLWNIAKAHYKLTTNASIQAAVNKIYNANRSIIGGNPDLIKPGEHLVLPAL